LHSARRTIQEGINLRYKKSNKGSADTIYYIGYAAKAVIDMKASAGIADIADGAAAVALFRNYS